MLQNFLFIFFFNPLVCCDAAKPWQCLFQDPATPIMEGIINFHNHIMFSLTMVAVFVTWLLIRCIYLFNEWRNTKAQKWTHSTILEIVWTLIPALIVMGIAVPSFALVWTEYIGEKQGK